MSNIDIKVDADLESLFELPPCQDLQVPNAESLSVKLPTGMTLKAFADISKGIPTDCSMTFSLMLQIAPFLAASDCLLKILKLLKPLTDIINGFTGGPPPSPKVLQEFAEAVEKLAPCLLIPTPASIIPFIKDLLCLILKVLNCFLSQIKSLLEIMSGLQLQLSLAQQSDNDELVGIIQCAQENAQVQASQIMNSLGPAVVLLELAGPLFDIAGIKTIQLPTLGDQTDLDSLNSAVRSVQEAVGVIQVVVDTLGGCD